MLETTGSYPISGYFAPYDFEGVDAAFDWVFALPGGGGVYQLQGIEPSANDVFGWKAVDVSVTEAAWVMAYLGDWDADGDSKFDWILVSPDAQWVYKLSGVTETGNFAYEGPIDIAAAVSATHLLFGSAADLGTPGQSGDTAMDYATRSYVGLRVEREGDVDISAIAPNAAVKGEQTAMTITGEGFREDTSVWIGLDSNNERYRYNTLESAYALSDIEVDPDQAHAYVLEEIDSRFLLHVLNIENPQSLYVESSWYTFGSTQDVEVSQAYYVLYVADGADGFSIFDMNHTSSTLSYYSNLNVDEFIEKVAVSEERSLAVLMHNRGLVLVDIHDFFNPTVISSVAVEGIAQDLTISPDGKTAYVASIFEGLEVIDLSDLDHPEKISSTAVDNLGLPSYYGASWPYAIELSDDGSTVYIADSFSLFIADVSDANDIQKLSSLDFDYGLLSSMAISKANDVVYLGSPYSGIYFVDVTRPDAPTIEGVIGSYGFLSEIALLENGDSTFGFLSEAYHGVTAIDLSTAKLPNQQYGEVDTSALGYGAIRTGSHAAVVHYESGNVLKLFELNTPEQTYELIARDDSLWRSLECYVCSSDDFDRKTSDLIDAVYSESTGNMHLLVQTDYKRNVDYLYTTVASEFTIIELRLVGDLGVEVAGETTVSRSIRSDDNSPSSFVPLKTLTLSDEATAYFITDHTDVHVIDAASGHGSTLGFDRNVTALAFSETLQKLIVGTEAGLHIGHVSEAGAFVEAAFIPTQSTVTDVVPDEANQRLFFFEIYHGVSSVDLATFTRLSRLDPGGVFYGGHYDAANRKLFVANSDGTQLFDVADTGTLRYLGIIRSIDGVHDVSYDAASGLVTENGSVLHEILFPTYEVVNEREIHVAFPDYSVLGSYNVFVTNDSENYAKAYGAATLIDPSEASGLTPASLELDIVGENPETVHAGEAYYLSALLKYDDGTTQDLFSNLRNAAYSISTSNEEVASVVLNKLVFKQEGYAVVTAKARGLEASMSFEVGDTSGDVRDEIDVVLMVGRNAKQNDLPNETVFPRMGVDAYRGYYKQGVKPENIHYFNATATEENHGELYASVDRLNFTASDLTQTIESMPASDKPLIIHLINHGEREGTIHLTADAGNLMSATQLAQAIRTCQSSTGREVIVIVDACFAGSFKTALEGPDRTLIFSSDDFLQPVEIASNFTYFLMHAIESAEHETLEEAFYRARSNYYYATNGAAVPLVVERDSDSFTNDRLFQSKLLFDDIVSFTGDSAEAFASDGAHRLSMTARNMDEKTIAQGGLVAQVSVTPPQTVTVTEAFETPRFDSDTLEMNFVTMGDDGLAAFEIDYAFAQEGQYLVEYSIVNIVEGEEKGRITAAPAIIQVGHSDARPLIVDQTP